MSSCLTGVYPKLVEIDSWWFSIELTLNKKGRYH